MSIQERITAKRADIEEALAYLLAGEQVKATLGPLMVPQQQAGQAGATEQAAIALQRRRLRILARLERMDEEQLRARAAQLLGKLSQNHRLAWLAESKGVDLGQQQHASAWAGPGDVAVRVELDLILIALGVSP